MTRMDQPVSDTPFAGLGRSYMLSNHNASSPLAMEGYDKAADKLVCEERTKTLDWGCGFGHLSRRLVDRGIQTESFDFVPGMDGPCVTTLTLYPGIGVRLTSDPVKLPYPECCFDSVVSMGTLEHVESPAASLVEIYRVLAPGGRLYVFRLPNRWSYVEHLARWTGRYYHGALPHDRVYSLRSAQALLESAGFLVLEMRRRDILPLTTVGSRLGPRYQTPARLANDTMSRVPLLSVLSTNLELVAARPSV